MAVRFSNPKPVEDKDFELLERRIGRPLPEVLREFYLKLNGAVPEKANFFIVSENFESAIQELIPISEAYDKRKYLHEFEGNALPLAYTEFGNYVLLDLEDGSTILFWDHELYDQQPITKLSNSIPEFLESIEPFDVDSIEIEEGKIISVIDGPGVLNDKED